MYFEKFMESTEKLKKKDSNKINKDNFKKSINFLQKNKS